MENRPKCGTFVICLQLKALEKNEDLLSFAKTKNHS